MTLDEILKPVKWVDEQVLRQYTKIAKKWEDKGRNLYVLASYLGIPSPFLMIFGVSKMLEADVIHYADDTWMMGFWIYAFDQAANVAGLTGKLPPQETTGEVVWRHPLYELTKRINRSTRLLTLLGGIGLVGKSACDIVNYFTNGEPFNDTTLPTLISGAGFIGTASSQYLKDRNPKLLDKPPFWEAAYNWAKEKASSLVPEPVPQPIPSTSFSLEKQIGDYI